MRYRMFIRGKLTQQDPFTWSNKIHDLVHELSDLMAQRTEVHVLDTKTNRKIEKEELKQIMPMLNNH